MTDKMERWEVTGDSIYARAPNEEPELVCWIKGENREAKAQLIVALYNSAVFINPSNPMAVAEGMKDVIDDAKEVISATKYMQIEVEHKEEIQKVNALIMSLARIEGKGVS